MATFISLNLNNLVFVTFLDALFFLLCLLTFDGVHLAGCASTLTAQCDPICIMNSLFRFIKLSAVQFLILMPKAL